MMNMLQVCLLLVSALFGGALNSVAGGGSFFTFPTLLWAGIAPVNANITSTITLWPGSVASAGAYRKDLMMLNKHEIYVLSGTSLIGGIVGAILLLLTSQSTFLRIVPYFLLASTLLFALSGVLTQRLQRLRFEQSLSHLALWRAMLIQLIVAIYGGYFGGAIGIMMLASFGLMGMMNIHQMNALKTLLTSCINGVAVLIFAVTGAVAWSQAVLMVVGAILGGYVGATFVRKIDQRWVKLFVVLVGSGLTVYFFFHH